MGQQNGLMWIHGPKGNASLCQSAAASTVHVHKGDVTLYGSLAATGKDLPSLYKETSAGGLAMQYRNNNVIPTGLEFQED